MRKASMSIVFALVFMAADILILPGQIKKVSLPSQRKPPTVRKCIDIIVDSFTATLVSTQVGTPGIEFPTDTVKLRAVLKNVGILPLPSDAFIELGLYRNNENIRSHSYANILGASGSAWAWTYTDTFVHGTPTLYLIYAGQGRYQECLLGNNGKSFYVNETLLHAAK